MVLPVHEVAHQGSTAVTSPVTTGATATITPTQNDATASSSSSSSSLNTTTTTKTLRGKLRKRTIPYPNTILDTMNFIKTLEELNLYGTKILPIHILAFYQALHRQHYPTLTDFVHNYYTNERNAQLEHSNRSKNNHHTVVATSSTGSNELDDDSYIVDESVTTVSLLVTPITTTSNSHQPPPHHHQQQQQQQPLKNRISNKKNFNRMQLPKPLLDFLRHTNEYVTLTSTVVQHKMSADGTTTKLMIQLHDTQIIESVIMRYTRPNKGGGGEKKAKSKTGYGNGRASLCVSSQCGCAMGCTVTYIILLLFRYILEKLSS